MRYQGRAEKRKEEPRKANRRGLSPFRPKHCEKGFGGGHVTLGAQAKVDRLTAGIHGAIEVHPAATNLDVRLIHAPPAPPPSCKAIPAPLATRAPEITT